MTEYSNIKKNTDEKENNIKFYCDNKNFRERAEKKTEDTELVTTGTYMKKKSPHKRWKEEETKKFYKALSICGCDFSLMEMIFKERSRKCLKEKFLKEMRFNRDDVENALQQHKQLDKEKLKKLIEM